MIRECDESKKIREAYLNASHPSPGIQADFMHSTSDSCQSKSYVMIVDGVWKRTKRKQPRASIGWSVFLNGTKAFEGNEMIVASSSLQAEAYALYKGLCEAHMKGI